MQDGKFLKKKNTFTDFVACAELLIQQKYTSPARLCVEGRSAGGLTMGAALNLRPDLFAAAVLGGEFSCSLALPVEAENSQPTNHPPTHRPLPK